MALTRPKHPARFVTVVVVAIIGVNVLIWGARAQVNGPAAKQRPNEIVALYPNEGELLLPQGMVGADVRPDFTGQIAIDGRVIPTDQITGDPNLGEVHFDPGPGMDIRELAKGPHNATIEWWPRTISTPEAARAQQQLRSYTWAFEVG
ncbi:MAG TPA: hypothetical protein VN636_13430 [Acidimicrobiia bacterium]|nr:hypothetical protein [Acidimicrobiia bacterium]